MERFPKGSLVLCQINKYFFWELITSIEIKNNNIEYEWMLIKTNYFNPTYKFGMKFKTNMAPAGFSNFTLLSVNPDVNKIHATLTQNEDNTAGIPAGEIPAPLKHG